MPETDGLILIVDDTQENIQVLGSLLRESGYRINVAASGHQALDALGRVTPDLVLLDIMMPEMSGFEVCRRMQENPDWSQIPIIFLTAKVEMESLVEGFKLGAVDYVTKPFHAEELLQRVDTHLTMSSLRKELAQQVAALSDALGKIEQLQREQDAFLRHELNNVISPIAGYANMLETTVGADLEERPTLWLQSISHGADSMQRMLTNLRHLNEVERGAHAFSFMPVPLYGIIKDVIRDIEMSSASPIAIRLEPETLDVTVPADLTFLPGVFKNLIKNACEHVVASENEATVAAGVQVVCSLSHDAVVIDVINGGTPLPDYLIPTFFEKFNSTKKESGGTGLGTTYAHIVTKAHEGNISVSSSKEEGTRVCVKLPRVVS